MPRWTDEEFLIVLRNRHLPPSQISALLPPPGRSIGAIAATLGGIDQYLNGRDVAGLLSSRGVAILEEELPR